MGRLIYRMCLIVVLLTAVAGGIYYYTTFYEKEEGIQKGTFVHNINSAEPAVQAGKQINKAADSTWSQAEEAAMEAFVYMGGQ